MAIIKLEKIIKKYGDRCIFDKYDLSIEEGEYICITGNSGAGKTTLLNIIGLLEPIENGTIEICNIKNPRIDSKSGRNLLRYKIAYLFQNYGLIEDQTVKKNMLISMKYSKYSNKDSIINDALTAVGLKGYEKKKIFQLSGGEQQRVAIAKLMVRPCEIILADEPTGSLDPSNREVVLSLIKNLNKNGKTIVMVTHDEVACSYAERVEKI